MSRTRRASIAAAFTYVQFGLAMLVGIVLVPFVLDRIGVRLYGYWLASGELLAYAAMADFGVLAVLPWLIAEADGRRDRAEIRRLLSTGLCAAVLVSLLYLLVAAGLWYFASGLVPLSAAERAAIAGPLALIAGVTAVVLPLRIASAALIGLQDVRVQGALATAGWAIDVLLTVILLIRGHGLYALAVGASVPSLVTTSIALVRLRVLAPDLVAGWPAPAAADVARLFREGFGGWLSAWGWRFSAATDAIVIAWIGSPVWITVLAMTGKASSLLMHMSWVPGDSGLVGLANLAGEGQADRVRAAVTAVFRVYLTLAGAGACAVLAANGAFVGRWVGPGLFGGQGLTVLLAALMLVATTVHGAAAVASVLGMRLRVGLATLGAGAIQIVLAVLLGRRLGLIGIPIAALCAQGIVLAPVLLRLVGTVSGVTPGSVRRDVWGPWAARAVPLIVLCAVGGTYLVDLPWFVALPSAGVAALAYLWMARGLLLEYPPVAAMVRARLAVFRLDGLLPLAGAERPPAP